MAGAFATLLVLQWLFAAAPAVAQGPPFPDRQDDVVVYDEAEIFSATTEQVATGTLRALRDQAGVDVVVYAQRKAGADAEQAEADAAALLEQWSVGGADGAGAVLLFDVRRGARRGGVAIAAGERYLDEFLDQRALDSLVEREMLPAVERREWDEALLAGVEALASRTQPPVETTPEPRGTASPRPTRGSTEDDAAPPPGPPFPPPEDGRVVYDHAGVLEPATETTATRTIVAIEQRTAAEVVVYTQVKPQSDTEAEAEQDAAALIDQWGVGRRGFDDGLAIFFDLDETLCHGQVQLYAGPGYAATFLSNADRERIFDEVMRPRLEQCELDAALLGALERIDANATPEHAASLRLARQLDAALGLVVAPLLLVLLVAWAGSSWMRFGKDPVYLDDPSIHMPAPPHDVTPATAVVIREGRVTRRAFTAAMLDLAARGEIAFRQDGDGTGVDALSIDLLDPSTGDPSTARARRRQLGPAEEYALLRLRAAGRRGGRENVVTPAELRTFGAKLETFRERLERHVTRKGWFREEPSRSQNRWMLRGGGELALGLVAFFIGLDLPSQGLVLIAAALLAAGVITIVLARAMPARTLAGAMVFAMLAAYRRTLEKTMAQARSMGQVLAEAQLPWLETPDQAAVWAVALGLEDDVGRVIDRTVEDLREGRADPRAAWLPSWYAGSPSATAGGASAAYSPAARGIAPGLFSASAVPDFGGMVQALGTLGGSSSSGGTSGSSGGSSGGFSGGSSGGGGGGAGGGF